MGKNRSKKCNFATEMENFKLYKREKLCSKTAIDQVFALGDNATAYPLRAVYRFVPSTDGKGESRFLITIPKKKIRTAVKRVLLRRRTREAYRLNRDLLLPALEQRGKRVDVAFIYLARQPFRYATIEAKMKELLTKIAAASQ